MKIINNKGLYKNFKLNYDDSIKFDNYFIENKIIKGSEYLDESTYKDENPYFIEFNGNNSQLFDQYNINQYSFQRKILGYTSNWGNFPFCKTKEDALKLFDELLSFIKSIKI